MTTPVEQSIQDEFESKLTESKEVSKELQQAALTLLKNSKLPSVDSLVTIIKAKSGDEML